jgi:hypothetical protein
MPSTRSFLAAVLATTIVLPACTADVEDDLAGEDGDGEAGKDDSNGLFTYFQLSVEPRVDAGLGGFIATRPNRTTIACGDTAGATCFVRSIDWTTTQLPDDVARTLEASLRQGAPILVRGETAAETATTRDRRLGGTASAALMGEHSTVLAASQPMLSIGADNGPDCLYAQLHVSKVSVAAATVTVASSTTAGNLRVEAVLNDVTITASSSYAVSCTPGAASLTIKIARVAIAGDITPGAMTQPVLDAVPGSATGVVVVGDALMPDTVVTMLLLREGNAAKVAARAARVVIEPIAAAETGSQLQLSATEAWLPSAGDASEANDDVFVLAKQEGARIREYRVNSTRTSHIDTIDFAASGALPADIDVARAALPGDGVILAGPRFLSSGKLGRRALQFWTRAE